jgi:hypothetical protein
MEINLKNIEEIIFFDKQVQHLLPEFRHLFDQWVLAYRNSGLKPLAKSSVFELMNNLDDSHIKKLENYFGKSIFINKLNHKTVDHYHCNMDQSERLCEFSDYQDLCLYRKGNDLNFTFWR